MHKCSFIYARIKIYDLPTAIRCSRHAHALTARRENLLAQVGQQMCKVRTDVHSQHHVKRDFHCINFPETHNKLIHLCVLLFAEFYQSWSKNM